MVDETYLQFWTLSKEHRRFGKKVLATMGLLAMGSDKQALCARRFLAELEGEIKEDAKTQNV